MNRTPKLLVALCLALPVPAAVAGCGDSGDSSQDPQEVLSDTFNSDSHVSSGVLDLSFDVSADGDQGGDLNVSLTGPFQTNPDDPNALPQLDLTASVKGAAAGQSVDFQGGLTLTDDNAFITYNDQAYEVGTDNFDQLKQGFESSASQADDSGDASTSFSEGCKAAIEAQGGDPSTCDFDLSSWFTELSNDGTEDVGGSETTHISGNLDVTTMLGDLLDIGLSVPSAAAQTGGLSPELIKGSLDTFSTAITDSGFDVYSATDDDTLRKLDFHVTIDPTQIPGGSAAGVSNVTLAFSVALNDVGSDQTIEGPADAKPFDQFLQDTGLGDALGGLGALGGLSGSGIPDLGSGSGGGSADDIANCMSQAQSTKEQNACLGL